MKRTLVGVLAGAIVISSLSVMGFGQEAGDIMNRMIEAQGGRKVLEALKDTTISGTMELIQQGMNATMTMYQKEPNLMRMDIEIMGMVITQAFDGQKGWFLNPQTGAAQDMDENMNKEFKRQALGNDSLLNPAKYGISYAFKGKEKVGDKECLVLEQTMSDGHKSTLYLDPDTYLMARSKTTSLSQIGAAARSCPRRSWRLQQGRRRPGGPFDDDHAGRRRVRPDDPDEGHLQFGPRGFSVPDDQVTLRIP